MSSLNLHRRHSAVRLVALVLEGDAAVLQAASVRGLLPHEAVLKERGTESIKCFQMIQKVSHNSNSVIVKPQNSVRQTLLLSEHDITFLLHIIITLFIMSHADLSASGKERRDQFS